MHYNIQIRPIKGAIIKRMPKTSGGEWFADTYTEYNVGTGRGIDDLQLRFKPNTTVDTESIGLTQSIQSIYNKTPFFLNSDPFYKGRAIDAKDAITTNVATGETDEGAMIDQLKPETNPLYAVNGSGAADKTLTDTVDDPASGQHGYHYYDTSKNLKEKDAKLSDAPKIKSKDVSKNSGQIFETTALAIKGNQAGTYYGAVRWGWRSDNAGNFAKIPLTVVSEGVPSSTFMKSAQVWNASKSSAGDETVDLPIIDIMTTKTPVTLIMPIPWVNINLPVGTRLQVLEAANFINTDTKVKVVDGPHVGNVGQISQSDWGTFPFQNIADERP